ncbi:transcription elongation factor A protein-like 7 isoform X2 [Mesocricetus auratus]|uniref:Transcription elongation factor A protein-like 7 isoform X2 n=1 Tax=Mesocricetus auratus TaxID=10036 RepID=A0ABM2XH90_MESAU|nr:transcription elongation factor A protein-like 7 isoform X2 [Mesocricetus auratus]
MCLISSPGPLFLFVGSGICVHRYHPVEKARNNNIMQKSSNEKEGKPQCREPKMDDEHPYRALEGQRMEGNFRQRLLQSLEEFKEDIDYRHFKGEEMTGEEDEMERCLEEIRSLRKKFRALHSNHTHSRDRPF